MMTTILLITVLLGITAAVILMIYLIDKINQLEQYTIENLQLDTSRIPEPSNNPLPSSAKNSIKVFRQISVSISWSSNISPPRKLMPLAICCAFARNSDSDGMRSKLPTVRLRAVEDFAGAPIIRTQSPTSPRLAGKYGRGGHLSEPARVGCIGLLLL